MTLEESTIQGIDGYKTELVTRSELVDEVLKHVLQSPEFIMGFVQHIESKIRGSLPDCSQVAG